MSRTSNTTPPPSTLAAALAALEPVAAAELEARTAHSAAEAAGLQAEQEFNAALAVMGATGLQTRDEIIAFVGGDPTRAAEPLAAIQRLDAAVRKERRLDAKWQKALTALDRATDAILTVPASPATALEKAMAYLSATGCRIAPDGTISSLGADEHLHLTLTSLVRDLTPTPDAFMHRLSPALAELLTKVADARAVLSAATGDDECNAACAVLNPLEAAVLRFPAQSVPDVTAKLELAARTFEEGGFAGGGLEEDIEAVVMREAVALLRQEPPTLPDPVAGSLDRAEAAYTSIEADVPDAFWQELDGDITGDPTTVRGLAWRCARARERINIIRGLDSSAGFDEVQAQANLAATELDSILRMTARMGVEPSLTLLAVCPEEAFRPGPLIAPLTVPEGIDPVASGVAFAAHLNALHAARVDGSDEALDRAAEATSNWVRTPAPNLLATIAKMEALEDELDGEARPYGAPSGFLSPGWVASLECGGWEGVVRLAVFRDLLLLAGLEDHPAHGGCSTKEDVRARWEAYTKAKGPGTIRNRSGLTPLIEPGEDHLLALLPDAEAWIEAYRTMGGDVGMGPDGKVWMGGPVGNHIGNDAACEAARAQLTPDLKEAIRAIVRAGGAAHSFATFEVIGSEQPERQVAALVGAMS